MSHRLMLLFGDDSIHEFVILNWYFLSEFLREERILLHSSEVCTSTECYWYLNEG